MQNAQINEKNQLDKINVIKYKFNDPDPHSFIYTGMKKPDMKLKTVKINGKEFTLENTMIVNPFFVGINGGSALTLTSKELFQTYKHVYVMCVKDNQKINKDVMRIFDHIIDKTLLGEICNKFTLIKTGFQLFRNYMLKKKANLVEKEILETYFNSNKSTDKQTNTYGLDEIVIPMFELNESKVNMYIGLHGGNTEINKITDIVSLVSYYNRSYKEPVEGQLNQLLTSIETTLYWKYQKNCNFNMNDIFNMRSLSYNGHRLDTIRYATLSGARSINNLLTSLSENKIKNKRDYHLSNTEHTTIKSEHMNISQVLRDLENRTFYPTIDGGTYTFKNDEIADLFDRISNEEQRYNLLIRLMVSKDYCHHVANNKRVLIRNYDLFEKYKPVMAYFFGYTWATLYLEESIFTTRSTKKNRFVFEIETACELPMFPFSMENLHHNPYLTIFLNRDLIDAKTNCMSIDALEDYKKYYGLCTKDEAFKRFNTFTSGKNGINLLDSLDSKIFSFSGSIIPACLQRRSPLIDLCTDENMAYDDIWTTFHSHYYSGADVDVMCGSTTVADFLQHGSTFLETICKNAGCDRSDLKIVPNKKMAVVVSKHFFKECVDDLNSELQTNYTADELIKIFEEATKENNEEINTLPGEILHYFYVDYVQEKNESIKKWKINQKLNNIEFDKELVTAYNTITPQDEMNIKMISYELNETMIRKKDSEMYYFVNDFRSEENQVPAEENFLVFKFGESIKFKISSDKIKRSLEIFMVSPVDPLNTVARFHKPCVRAYFQGKNIYMLPSFITSMMTLINIDYKYFAGSRDPIEIINKYRMRGYSVILNTNEKKSVYMYNKNVDNCNGMFKVDESNKNKFFGPRSLNDNIFKPGVYKLGLPQNIYKPSEHRYIKSVQELKNYYSQNYGYNFDKASINIFDFTTISSKGNMEPLQIWVADAFFDFVNKN